MIMITPWLEWLSECLTNKLTGSILIADPHEPGSWQTWWSDLDILCSPWTGPCSPQLDVMMMWNTNACDSLCLVCVARRASSSWTARCWLGCDIRVTMTCVASRPTSWRRCATRHNRWPRTANSTTSSPWPNGEPPLSVVSGFFYFFIFIFNLK